MESELSFLDKILQSDIFMPHGHCYLWSPDVLWTHVISDLVIFCSYYSIPIAIIYLIIKRRDLPFNWIFWLFGLFIILCGTTHLMDVWTTWNATYRLEGILKAMTALVSLITAIVVWPLIPKALAIPSKKELEESNKELNKKSDALKKASRYKSEFLANMSHELRTPLNSILMLSHVLSENAAEKLTQDELESIKTIKSSGKDLLNLIDDILDISKVEAGKLEIFPEHVFLENIIKDLKALFKPISDDKNIPFDIHVNENCPESIFTDELRVKQILRNLLSNAFKFTNTGSINIQFKTVKKSLVISVSDTGIGIPKNKQKMIFRPFRQADGTTTRRYGGTGLGLSISKNMAERLGGHLEMQSEVNKGSTFSLHLPLNNQIDPTSPKPTRSFDNSSEDLPTTNLNQQSLEDINSQEPFPDYTEKTVLIVDDDMRDIFSLKQVLITLNLNVKTAKNGIEAIEKLHNYPNIDLVLMDIIMPEMSGLESIKKIRKSKEFKNLPVIALTAKITKKDHEEYLEIGANDHLEKPIDLEKLRELLRKWI